MSIKFSQFVMSVINSSLVFSPQDLAKSHCDPSVTPKIAFCCHTATFSVTVSVIVGIWNSLCNDIWSIQRSEAADQQADSSDCH